MHMHGLQCFHESEVLPWSGLLQQLCVCLQPLLRYDLGMWHLRVRVGHVRTAWVGGLGSAQCDCRRVGEGRALELGDSDRPRVVENAPRDGCAGERFSLDSGVTHGSIRSKCDEHARGANRVTPWMTALRATNGDARKMYDRGFRHIDRESI